MAKKAKVKEIQEAPATEEIKSPNDHSFTWTNDDMASTIQPIDPVVKIEPTEEAKEPQALELENGIKIMLNETDTQKDIEEKVRSAMQANAAQEEIKAASEPKKEEPVIPEDKIVFDGSNALSVMKFCNADHIKVVEDGIHLFMGKKNFVLTPGEILYKVMDGDKFTITKVFTTSHQVVS